MKVHLLIILISGLLLLPGCTTPKPEAPLPERPFVELTPDTNLSPDANVPEEDTWVSLPSKKPLEKDPDDPSLETAFEEQEPPLKPHFEPYIEVTNTPVSASGLPANKVGTSPAAPTMSTPQGAHQGDPPRSIGVRGSIDF